MTNLGEELASLLNPTPDANFDPEDAFRAPEENSNSNSTDLKQHSEQLQELETHKSQLRDVEVGTEYEGVVASRSHLQAWSSADSDYGEELEEALSASGSEGNEDAQSEEQTGVAEVSARSSSSEGEPVPTKAPKDATDEPDSLAAALETVEDEDTALLSQQGADDQLQRAKAVQRQVKLYDAAVNIRIRLQKVLKAAQQLPHPDSIRAVCEANVGVKRKFEEAQGAGNMLLQELYSTHNKLLESNHAIPEPLRKRRKLDKPSLEDWSGVFEEEWKEFSPYWNRVLDLWNRKTQLTSGGKRKLRSLNKSIITQISEMMEDPSGLVARSRVVDETHKSLCSPFGGITSDIVQSDRAIRMGSLTNKSQRVDQQVYDDANFYHEVLRELVTGSSVHGQLGRDDVVRKRRSYSKQKKNVDRKASKGRRIRYTVIPQLENFMAPQPHSIDPEFLVSVDQLFSSLFQ